MECLFKALSASGQSINPSTGMASASTGLTYSFVSTSVTMTMEMMYYCPVGVHQSSIPLRYKV